MTATVLAIFIWLWVASELLRFRPVRSRRDLWPFVLLWPVALALIVAVLAYELVYRGARWALRGKAVRP